jgi:hypothetical protein
MLKKRYFEQNTRTFVKKTKLKIKNLKALMLKKIRKNENKR